MKRGVFQKSVYVNQRKYVQVKGELWEIVYVVKVDCDYIIGVEVIIEINCLLILGKIFECTTLNVALLQWIAYIKSLNLEIWHVLGKHNSVADMLSRARYEGENEMQSDDEDVHLDIFKMACAQTEEGTMQVLTNFKEEEYEGEWRQLGKFLSLMKPEIPWSKEETRKIRKKAYKFFLKEGFLWKHPKKR